jgi:hypothetical protein
MVGGKPQAGGIAFFVRFSFRYSTVWERDNPVMDTRRFEKGMWFGTTWR